ncbi:MAG: hypothetical protein QOD77_1761 [Thermoplasmata archaeon]|jgi:hypothetical protein|nr:hypothetical protein [Thermoplasmata archaeon]
MDRSELDQLKIRAFVARVALRAVVALAVLGSALSLALIGIALAGSDALLIQKSELMVAYAVLTATLVTVAMKYKRHCDAEVEQGENYLARMI